MVPRSIVCAALLGVPLVGAALTALGQPVASQTAGAEAVASVRREAFLQGAGAAFAARDAKGLEALADVTAWRAAGYPEPATLPLFLPPAPIHLEKELTPSESLWRDGTGRTWRLVTRDVKGELKAVVRASPCPRGIVMSPGVVRPEKPAPKVESWTILECWPLPK